MSAGAKNVVDFRKNKLPLRAVFSEIICFPLDKSGIVGASNTNGRGDESQKNKNKIPIDTWEKKNGKRAFGNKSRKNVPSHFLGRFRRPTARKEAKYIYRSGQIRVTHFWTFTVKILDT